jgi:hypothetical protein
LTGCGHAPIKTASRFRDAAWTCEATTLRCSHQIATGAPDTPVPLLLPVKPQLVMNLRVKTVTAASPAAV